MSEIRKSDLLIVVAFVTIAILGWIYFTGCSLHVMGKYYQCEPEPVITVTMPENDDEDF